MGRKIGVSWWTKLNEEALTQLNLLCNDVSIKYVDIAAEYNVKPAEIRYYAEKIGAPPRRMTQKRLNNVHKNGPLTTLSVVDAELAAIASQQEALRKKMEDLRAKRAELQIRCEWEDGHILLYGVGTEPFKATPDAWASFLNNAGAQKLRDCLGKGGKR